MLEVSNCGLGWWLLTLDELCRTAQLGATRLCNILMPRRVLDGY